MSAVSATVRSLGRGLARRLPPQLVARVELIARPAVRDQWGGGFNGQQFRRRLALALIEHCDVQTIIETGTYRGSTTEYLTNHFGGPIHTIESFPRFYHYARLRLRAKRNVHLHLGSSVDVLTRIAASAVSRQRVFFYLDAHWRGCLPIREELDIISRNWSNVVVMIDDFQVPGDPNYGYDDYGDGLALTLDHLGDPGRYGFRGYYPSCPSHQETGAQRGTLILADREAADRAEGTGLMVPLARSPAAP